LHLCSDALLLSFPLSLVCRTLGPIAYTCDKTRNGSSSKGGRDRNSSKELLLIDAAAAAVVAAVAAAAVAAGDQR
jgi:hypothetical protein